MEVLRFEEFNRLIKEYNEEFDHDADVIDIDLNDDHSKIEVDKRYSFLGVEFTPKYSNSGITKEPYSVIIRKPGIKDGRELYWGKIIHSKSLEELQNEIRVEIKFYLEDEEMKIENKN